MTRIERALLRQVALMAVYLAKRHFGSTAVKEIKSLRAAIKAFDDEMRVRE